MRSAATGISARLACAIACAFLFAPQTAHAHKRSVRRAVMLETKGDRELQIIVAIRIPSGERRRAFDLLADANHDGVYSANERAAVRELLAARALDGLAIRTATAALPWSGIRVKEKVGESDGPIEVMLHATAVFAGGALAVTTSNIGDPVDLLVLRGSRAVVSTSRGRVENGGVKAELGLGDRVTVELR